MTCCQAQRLPSCTIALYIPHLAQEEPNMHDPSTRRDSLIVPSQLCYSPDPTAKPYYKKSQCVCSSVPTIFLTAVTHAKTLIGNGVPTFACCVVEVCLMSAKYDLPGVCPPSTGTCVAFVVCGREAQREHRDSGPLVNWSARLTALCVYIPSRCQI